jgi:hypothetical protein
MSACEHAEARGENAMSANRIPVHSRLALMALSPPAAACDGHRTAIARWRPWRPWRPFAAFVFFVASIVVSSVALQAL